MTWTREHDRTLAEKCEGLEVINDHVMRIPSGDVIHIPLYCDSIHATIRAAELWRRQKPDGLRIWHIGNEGMNAGFFAVVSNRDLDGSRILKSSATPAAALAWALYEAVTHA